MASRLPSSLLPRFLVLGLFALFATATATLTFAAENGSRETAAPKAQPAAVPAPKVLVVPDVRAQVYVFAKGTLEEGGFAWKVSGPVAGYSANRVAAQTPAPGTRVLDTGAPTIALTLRANSGYPQEGTPENASPFPGTDIRLADVAAVPKTKPKRKPAKKQAPAPKRKAKQPKPKPKPAAKAKERTKRPPAFAVPGGKPEPLDEMPLPARASRLGVWLTPQRRPTDANVRHWLYQHAWVVEGARLGWWHGAEALQTLIRVDERAQAQWEIGAKSEAQARGALAEVRRKSR